MAKAKAKEEATEEVIEDAELEELEADVDGDEAPAKGKGGKTKADDAVTFGVASLVELIKEKTGKEYSTRDLRTLIRKLAREDNPKVKREVIPGNRTRYDWPKGEKDPEVKAILKAVSDGGIEAGKKEALDALKARKAEKKAKGEDGSKKAKKNKKSKS
jgi:hypothetical protein